MYGNMMHDPLLKEIFTVIVEGSTSDCDGADSCRATIYAAYNSKIMLAKFCGSIGLPCIDRFTQSLEQTLTGNVESIIVDFEDVQKLSRSAIGELINFAAAVIGRGKNLYLYGASDTLRQRLMDLNITEFFIFLNDADKLVQILPIE